MPGAVAELLAIEGIVAENLGPGTGESLDELGEAVAVCVVPELEAEPSFDDLLQATPKTIKRMTIVMLRHFIMNLLILMSMPVDNP